MSKKTELKPRGAATRTAADAGHATVLTVSGQTTRRRAGPETG
jgi:hypothetical protein